MLVCICTCCTVMIYSTSCYLLTTFWIHGICSNVCLFVCVCVCARACVGGWVGACVHVEVLVCIWCMYVRSNSYCCHTPYVPGTTFLVHTVHSCSQHSVAADRLTSEYLGSVLPPADSMPHCVWMIVKWIENADGECTVLPVCHFSPHQQSAMRSLPYTWCGATLSPYVTNCSRLDCSVLCLQFSWSVMQNDGHYCQLHVA
jgi:hypothetical protein